MIPLIVMPFLFIFFYVYKSSFGKEKSPAAGNDSLQVAIAPVSDQVKNKELSGKLDAFRSEYKKSDGYTAVGNIAEEEQKSGMTSSLYNEREKRMLDSIDQVMKAKYGKSVAAPGKSFPDLSSSRPTRRNLDQDRALAEAISKINRPQGNMRSVSTNKPAADPMQLFRQQMALVDSMGKANDPEYQRKKRLENQSKSSSAPAEIEKKLTVSKVNHAEEFNSIRADEDQHFLSAIIDQDITGFSGSRLRIRLLDDMMAGRFLVKKGTYLYALISGFSGQRVLLSVTSILQGDELLPVKLDLYDQDGMKGLYVPASAFRDFTKDLGVNSSSGITLQNQAENNNQLVMGMLSKMFQSTTAAVGKLIRSNKAKIKYNTNVLLIDPDQLSAKQKQY